MRDKEAIEAERKNLARNLEKQGKLIERLVDTERNLSGQVVRQPSVLSISENMLIPRRATSRKSWLP
jgi:hypothetical protein